VIASFDLSALQASAAHEVTLEIVDEVTPFARVTRADSRGFRGVDEGGAVPPLPVMQGGSGEGDVGRGAVLPAFDLREE